MNLYRPQFPYPAVPGCNDEQFSYSFDKTNVPFLAQSIAAGNLVIGIPFPLDQDAPFSWRGMRADTSSLLMRLRDPFGNYLDNDFSPIDLYMAQQGLIGSLGALAIPTELAIDCPMGGIILLDLKNPTASPISPGAFTLLGIKRRNPDLARCA
jgi:hypothetical protein